MPKFRELRELHIANTKEKLSKLPDDFLIISVLRAGNEVSRNVKTLELRLKEWYMYYSGKEDRVENIAESNFDKNLADFASEIMALTKLHENLDSYLLSLMKRRCPKLTSVSNHVLGARLIAYAGSLEKLARMPSSKIQLLGAEKALFRHLKSGNKPPKYGIIYMHESIMNSENKGQAARRLASKIAIAARQDFYGVGRI